jgi:hypothetical protein
MDTTGIQPLTTIPLFSSLYSFFNKKSNTKSRPKFLPAGRLGLPVCFCLPFARAKGRRIKNQQIKNLKRQVRKLKLTQKEIADIFSTVSLSEPYYEVVQKSLTYLATGRGTKEIKPEDRGINLINLHSKA